MSYRIVILPAAEKEIEKIPPKIAQSLFEKIYALATDPRPFGYKKLNNFKVANLKLKPLYRIRSGDFRIVYGVQNDILTITIVKIAHRKEVYD